MLYLRQPVTHLVCTPDMDLHDQVPVLILHVLETNIPEDTSIVDEHINPAISLDGRLDNLVTILDRVVIRNGLSASCLDLFDYNICGLCARVRR